MKAQIEIVFKEIAGRKVNDRLLEENPNLSDVTTQTITKLCQTIKKYFRDYKIKAEVNFKLEYE